MWRETEGNEESKKAHRSDTRGTNKIYLPVGWLCFCVNFREKSFEAHKEMQTSKLYLFYEFKTISYDIEVSGKDIESGIKSEGEKSQKIPRNISGCVLSHMEGMKQKWRSISITITTAKRISQDSFILLNSVMADAMEILQEIRNIKAETRK